MCVFVYIHRTGQFMERSFMGKNHFWVVFRVMSNSQRGDREGRLPENGAIKCFAVSSVPLVAIVGVSVAGCDEDDAWELLPISLNCCDDVIISCGRLCYKKTYCDEPTTLFFCKDGPFRSQRMLWWCWRATIRCYRISDGKAIFGWECHRLIFLRNDFSCGKILSHWISSSFGQLVSNIYSENYLNKIKTPIMVRLVSTLKK